MAVTAGELTDISARVNQIVFVYKRLLLFLCINSRLCTAEAVLFIQGEHLHSDKPSSAFWWLQNVRTRPRIVSVNVVQECVSAMP